MNTPTILKRILERKEEEIASARRRIPFAELRSRARDCEPTRGFETAMAARIQAGAAAVIAEIKKASPSKGVIREDFDAAAIAASYARGGATCLSVLTDRDFFQGSNEYLQQARSACPLPALRKDFMLEPYQIIESRVLGADCILLILAALGQTQLADLHGVALEAGLDVLIEVHSEAELERALALNDGMIGINNRDLHSFVTDLNITYDLLPMIPPQRLVVTESGILQPADVAGMRARGVSAFLVGEAFMRAADPGAKLAELFA